MPKLKTHKGAAARFRFTGRGKLMRMKRMQSHLRLKKPKRVKRQFGRKIAVSQDDVGQLKRVLPYGRQK
ncbi:MAG: 50S ribosomal protein L35 [Chloroflexi bacterium]|nr:50S ribosomal protein L35 [Chloroflexota bacterium]